MTTPVTMPLLGESVTEGTVTRWLKREGEHVAADEPLLEVSTDKVDTEIPAPVTGTLLQIKVSEDETVEIGVELAVIGAADGDVPGPDPAAPGSGPEVTSAAPPDPTGAVEAPAEPTVRPDVAGHPLGLRPSHGPHLTLLVRTLAADRGVDLDSISGSGAGGRIRKADVLAAARTRTAGEEPSQASLDSVPSAGSDVANPAIAAGDVVQPMSRLRRSIATGMLESLRNSAQLTTVIEIDVTRVSRNGSAVSPGGSGVKTPRASTPFIAVAAVAALREHPVLNASLRAADGGSAATITYHDGVQLGVAVHTEHGLRVPVLGDADDLNVAGLGRRMAEAGERARADQTDDEEPDGATFTLMEAGDGVLFDTPILRQPQVAVLSVGATVKRAVVLTGNELGDAIAVRSMLFLALTYDHRVVDGADAARFLAAIKQRVEGGSFD